MSAERTAFDALADSIVNPRCDDCGTAMSTPALSQIGFPRQCGTCQRLSERRYQIRFRDWTSQERPRGRTVHVVKLPESMRRKSDA
jgi:hypothetical protein